jgi:hypothetical protein
VRLAARGTRETDGGTGPVADEAEAAVLRRQALTVWMQSLVAAAIATALLFLLPR